MLRVIDLSYSRNEQTLFSGLSFNVAAGEALHITAANGVGKTTLLKILAGINLNYTGQIVAENVDKIYLGHQSNLHPALTPHENLKFLLAGNTSDSLIISTLKKVGLQSKADQICAELSAGQLQRVNLARLFLTAARIWLLDEPLVNLDANSKELFVGLCLEHLKCAGICIFAAHSDLSLRDIPIRCLNLETYG